MKVKDLKEVLYATWIFIQKGDKTIEEVKYIQNKDYFYEKYGRYEIEELTSFPAKDQKIIIKIK